MSGINSQSVLIDSSNLVRSSSMPDIKENIKQELLKMIEEERNNIYYRRVNANYLEENYQIQAEENFINRLERFVKSI